MSSYHFNDIEAKWQKHWAAQGTFHAKNNSEKPKYYVLDMFPYPSGAGLHVGHPLGYIASDVYARFKRHQGYNVLHPMGYDSFGLPAEQYAIQTGQHPADTTKVNIEGGVDKLGTKIEGYRNQMDRIGFSFDWSREVRTSNPDYYKWTQWIFIQLFESWYCKTHEKAFPISELEKAFSEAGNSTINAACDSEIAIFSAEEWNGYSEKRKHAILLKYRLTYLAETEVNWCPELGTVLANDEIVNGVSERGGYAVIRKKMMQWSMRITAYAQRLLDGLEAIDWPQPLKDTQTNWIGRSEGATVVFPLKDHDGSIEVFTTRPDTIFGVSFMTLAPEHELVARITTMDQRFEVSQYIEAAARKSERDRMADVKNISGVFTGAYAVHPLSGEEVPIWIGDYVLAGYGTGAVMAVPCGDQRDYDFAKHFNIPIPNIFDGVDISEEAFADKENTVIGNSDFLNGLNYKDATRKAIEALEAKKAGSGKINYRLRDAVFSRQRYWGEPFPVYYKNGLPQMIAEVHLPIELPEVEKYLPTESGEPPLGRAEVWAWDTSSNKVVPNTKIDHETVFPLELNTMPGWAGSSCYMFRYMDPHNDTALASKEAMEYWENVDLYVGGSEHATGHLLYSRFWVKFLYDRGFLLVDEPIKKLINQGMILGESAFVYRATPLLESAQNGVQELTNIGGQIFVSENLVTDTTFDETAKEQQHLAAKMVWDQLEKKNLEWEEGADIKFRMDPIHADVSMINLSNELNVDAFANWREDFNDAKFILEDGSLYSTKDSPIEGGQGGVFKVSREVEKMSKSKYNVVNPDDICKRYGADTLRLYEMFLGPLEQAKPWSTAGITGVHSFLKKLWKLYHSGANEAFLAKDGATPSADSYKTLHKTIKKVAEDIENFSFNTSVSTFMIAVNELTAQRCNHREILAPLAILISPYAPHIAEELWEKLGHTESISTAPFPKFEEKYVIESTKTYPISFNGKTRFTMDLSLDLSKDEIEAAVMGHEKTLQYLEGRTPKKVIIVPGKIINIVG